MTKMTNLGLKARIAEAASQGRTHYPSLDCLFAELAEADKAADETPKKPFFAEPGSDQFTFNFGT